MKTFEEILIEAYDNHWCVNPNCTTCGARDLKAALRDLDTQKNKGLIEALAEVNISKLSKYPGWFDCLHIALNLINKSEDMDFVLSAWLPNLDDNIAIADLVLFYFVRRGYLFAPMSPELGEKWVNACFDMAIKYHHESLIESLIYTRLVEVEGSQELMKIIESEYKDSQRIRKAFRFMHERYG